MKASERHKLKHDLYADSVVTAAVWAQRHQTRILLGVAVALVAGACAVWAALSHQSAREAGLELLSEIEAAGQKAVAAKGEARDNAIKDAVARCDLLAADYANSNAAPLAMLRAGQLYGAVGRFRDAVPYFRRALELGGDKPGLAALARRGQAEALEESGKLQQAIEQYRLLIDSDASAAGVEANWDIGRCYDQLGESDRAEEFYKKVIAYGGNSAWADLARASLSRRNASSE